MSAINPHFRPKQKKLRSLDEYIGGITDRNKYILAEVITLLESTNATKREMGIQVIRSFDADLLTHRSTRIGITGSPGVGKSTFINAYAEMLAEMGHSVAVLAVDPTSQPTSGSILGDKTRMDDLYLHTNIFVRPSPAGDILGGVARGTWEAIEMCHCAKYDYILVETVGVGQSEHMASQMVDVMLLLLQVGAGDDLQGIKRGIVEMADLFVINKDDGPHKELARQAQIYYKQALSFFERRFTLNYDRVFTCSSIDKVGIEAIHGTITKISDNLHQSGLIYKIRKENNHKKFENLIKDYVVQKVMNLDLCKKYLIYNSELNINDYFARFELFKHDFEDYIKDKKAIDDIDKS